MKVVLWTAVIVFSVAAAARSEGTSRAKAEEILIGYWTGESINSNGLYRFHTVNCANGRTGTALIYTHHDSMMMLGTWSTDGTTITDNIELVAAIDPPSLDLYSLEFEQSSITYHIVELTESRMIYEWRGESSRRRFAAEKSKEDFGISREELRRLACDARPAVS